MDELAELLSSEHGKVIADSKGNLQCEPEVVEFVCGISHLLKGEIRQTPETQCQHCTASTTCRLLPRASIQNPFHVNDDLSCDLPLPKCVQGIFPFFEGDDLRNQGFNLFIG